MEYKVDTSNVSWWFWALTLVGIIAALGGWPNGYVAVMAISALHAAFYLLKEKSASAFPTQIRLVYFAATLFGLWHEVRFFVYLVLLVGTFMVTFFGRCSVAAMLKHMPWNQHRELRLN